MTIATKKEIEDFLANTALSRYQRISLPYGLEIPGRDNSEKLDLVFSKGVEDKSVLDVGCYYGLYCHEAKNRGASKAAGVEMVESRAHVARTVAGFLENDVQIMQGDILGLEIAEKFDVVLLLSVLHHSQDPILLMRKLHSLCSELMIVEFSRPTHTLIRRTSKQKVDTPLNRIRRLGREWYQRVLIKLLDSTMGFIATGEEIDDGPGFTYFYNHRAFKAVYKDQLKLFKSIEFEKSPLKPARSIAFCRI
jgi:SAM-dependent methyltransferase